MAVYYKFKSAKDFDSIPIDGHFISVANLKERIFESKLGRGTGFDLMVANAQTNEEYLDEATLIPKNTSLLVRRVPLQRRMPIIANREEPKTEVNILDHEQPAKTFSMESSSISRYPAQTEGDEFGNDLYAIPEVMPTQSNNTVQHAPDFDKADEDGKIKALIDSSALDWQMQSQDSFGAGRGFGRGMGGRMTGGRGFGRVGFERRTPPQGYICHRCEMPGHYIQHCPTNGDPTYDKKRVKNPTGIPKDMLVVSADGSYTLPSGAVAFMKPNEAAFDKEVEGLSSTRVVGELPPELHCPMCKEVMKDAVLTSKCCFNSFCDKCIRNRILSNSTCVCGATNILADDLLPNKTVRDTINRILESNNSSTENAGSVLQIHDTESARRDQPKIPSPTISATSKGERMPSSSMKDTPELKEAANGGQTVFKLPQQSLEKGRTAKAVDLSEVTLESNHDKEPVLQGSASHAEEEVQQKLPTGEPGKKKKKKKTLIPVNAAEMQWRASQEFPAENYMMPFAPPTYDPYWGGMQYGMDGYMAPFNCAMPYMGYAPGPFDVPYGGQGYPMPVAPPQRDLSGFGMGFNPAPPMSREEFEARKAPSISREEFEARKADLRRKQEGDRRGQRDWESGRELSNNADISSVKSKSRIIAQETIHNPRMEGTHRMDGNHRMENVHGRERQPREAVEPIRPGKNRAEEGKEVAEHKSSVFSRISFPEGESSKKRKPSSSDANKSGNPSYGYKDMESTASYGHHKPLTNGYHDVRKPAIKEEKTRASSGGGGRQGLTMEQDSSDDEEERHFKRRKPARYEPQSVEWEEDAREMRISRENTRDPDRGRQHDREYKQERGHRHSHSHSHSHGQR